VKDKTAKDEPITIKKYANRRLYNTATSSYVTLDHLCEMVKEGTEFVVFDAKTGDDITRSVLTQIIFEEENKGQSMMPIRFLRQLIRFYGDSLQSFVPSYLEVSMETFSRNQEDMRKRITEVWGGAQSQALKDWEGQARHNMQLFQQAFRMFTPFLPNLTREQAESKTNGADEAPTSAGEAREITDLKRQLQTMQRQIDALTQKAPDKA
jgi:polyhydroxyalkanoate synthesis repressor PhaR